MHSSTEYYNSRYHRKRYIKMRETAIEKYGGKCICCGITQFEFLTFDHRDGKPVGKGSTGGGYNLVIYLLQAPVIPEIRVMCYNCNCSRGFRGYCPHERANLLGATETK